jgi:phenylalanyl-tRNA synthetase beta chain
MKFSYNWLKANLSKIPKPEKMAEILTLHSFEVKEIKRMGDDWLIDIDILPNRMPDCSSHLGVAREIAVLTGAKLKEDKYKLTEVENLKAKDFLKVQVKNPKDCPRYIARVVIDVKVGPSPKWIQDRLIVCGLRPINNIVDITNYVMLETGQPLHAFDGLKLVQKKIIVRRAKKPTVHTQGEKIVTLDEGRYNLDQDILVIADTKLPVAIAGIKGGKEPEIDSKTRIVVIESANFNQGVIRHASQKLNLKTDASLRFEAGISPNLTEFAINRAASLMGKVTGGKIAKGLIDVYPKKFLPRRIRLNLDYVKSLLGVEIPKKEIINILRKLEFKIYFGGENTPLFRTAEMRTAERTRPVGDTPPQRGGVVHKAQSSKLEVMVPTRRLDVSIPEDLIEEIGRVYGYQKIPAIFPRTTLVPPVRNFDRIWEELVRNSLKEAGFSETYNYSFIGEKQKETFSYLDRELIEIENPISNEQKYLRPSLIPDLLRNVRDNFRYFEEVRLFELGKVYTKERRKLKNQKIIEKRMLAGLITKKEASRRADEFYQLKGAIDSLLNKLGISDIWYDNYKPTPSESKISLWQKGKAAEIKINQTEIGFLGSISPKILGDLKIKAPIFLFDLDFELLLKFALEEQEFKPISRYPAAVRDLAILVPLQIRVEEVLNRIEIAAGPLLRDIDLFDIYEGEELPEGKKNLAFHLVYQAEDRTLPSKEIDNIHSRIIKSLEEEPEWQVRK